MIAEHSARTCAWFGLLGRLPQLFVVLDKQGSAPGKKITLCVGAVKDSATFGARLALL